MAGEGREAHLDRLLVADVGEHRGRRRAAPPRPPAAAARPGGARAASPSVFSATVLPPVFGPLMTSARRPAEVEVDRHRGRRDRAAGAARRAAAPRRRCVDRRAAPAARERPQASARSSAADGLDERAQRAPRCAPTRRGQLAQDPLDLLALGARPPRTAGCSRSTIANGSTNSVWPDADASWTIPGTLRARARLHGEHRPAAALGDEVLLQVLAQLRSAASRRSSSATRCRPSRSSARRRRSVGDALSRRSRAVLLDAAADRVGDARPAPDRSAPATSARSGATARVRPRARLAAATAVARRSRPRRAARAAPACRPARPCATASRTSRDAVERGLLRHRRAARSPRRSAPGGAHLRPRRATARARARAPRPTGVAAAPASRSTIAG